MSQSNIHKLVDYISRPVTKTEPNPKTTKQLLAMLFAHSARAKRAYTPRATIKISVLDQDGNPAVRIKV